MSSSEDEYDPAGALEDLDASIDSLEAILEPLLSGKLTWQELVEQESEDAMGKAKLNMMMAFGVCDLLFGESRRMGNYSVGWKTDMVVCFGVYSLSADEGA